MAVARELAPEPGLAQRLEAVWEVTYDPGFLSTASCSSAITYIDGDKGELLYRGYPIDQIAVQ